MRNLTNEIIAAWFATIAMAFAADGWTTDWQAAKDRSKAENKPIFIYLTGSDWCGWCKKLEKEVILKKEFMEFAKLHFVHVHFAPIVVKLHGVTHVTSEFGFSGSCFTMTDQSELRADFLPAGFGLLRRRSS